MSDSSHDASADRQAIADLLEGQLDAEETERLTKRLLADADLRREYVRHAAMQALLRWRSGLAHDEQWKGVDPSTVAQLLDEAEQTERQQIEAALAQRAKQCVEQAARERRMQESQLARPQRSEPIVIPWSVVYGLSTAAAVAVALFVYQAWPKNEQPPVVEAETPAVEDSAIVATLVDAMEARWGTGARPVAVGTRLERGPYELTDGFVQIEFQGGATTVIEAPAQFELLARDVVQLKRGKLAGDVPPQAVGFSVNTPLTTIVDLGTAFGVAIDGQENVQVQVFEGAVEAVLSDSANRVELREGRTVEVATVDGQTQLSDIEVDAGFFVREMPDQPAYARAVIDAGPFLYWRFESAPRGVVPNEMAEDFAASIAVGRAGSNGLVDGVMRFDAFNTGLVAICDSRRNLPLDGDYSIEFWMQPNREHHGAIVAIGAPTGLALKPQHSVIFVGVCGEDGREQRNNVLGFLRFLHRDPPGTEGGTSCYSSERYAIGQWQHVVAVREGTAMRLFVDGQLSVEAQDPGTTPDGLQMHVGQLYRGDPIDRSFVGELDEVAVYDRALTPAEIEAHAELGRPGHSN